jgi:hypothetical protein
VRAFRFKQISAALKHRVAPSILGIARSFAVTRPVSLKAFRHTFSFTAVGPGHGAGKKSRPSSTVAGLSGLPSTCPVPRRGPSRRPTWLPTPRPLRRPFIGMVTTSSSGTRTAERSSRRSRHEFRTSNESSSSQQWCRMRVKTPRRPYERFECPRSSTRRLKLMATSCVLTATSRRPRSTTTARR